MKSVVRRPRISRGYEVGKLGTENWEVVILRLNDTCMASDSSTPLLVETIAVRHTLASVNPVYDFGFKYWKL